jgi:Ribbon-helix-helix protein, copG family
MLLYVYMQHRMQILIDQSQYKKVQNEAKRRGLSIGAVIREAIDKLPDRDEERRRAIAALLAAEPIELPADPADLRRELDEAHDRFPD